MLKYKIPQIVTLTRNNDLLLYFLHVWGKCGEKLDN